MNKKEIIGKAAVHSWMNVNFGKPKKCDHCGTTDENKTYDWANKDHTYKRLREDFQRLCRSCHRKYDKVVPPSQKGKHRSEEEKALLREYALKQKRDKNRFVK